MLDIKIILGSTRPNRFSQHAGAWIESIAKGRDDMQVELLDLRNFPMPFYDEPVSPTNFDKDYPNPKVQKWAEKVSKADGFIFVTPEYNHGTSAVLKNALDSVFKEWNYKAVGFVAYGSVGGARAVEHLRLNAIELYMASARTAVHIFEPWNLVDKENNLKGDALKSHEKEAGNMLDELVFFASALKKARKEQD